MYKRQALLGIILCHYNHWHAAYLDMLIDRPYSALSRATEWFNTYYLVNKFYILFSFIFGFSFYLQSQSFKKYSGSTDLKLYRRAIVLFLIGAIHYIGWMGDILFVYGVLMVPLVFIRKWSSKALLLTAGVCVINLPTMLLYAKKLLSPAVVEPTGGVGGIPPTVSSLYHVVTSGGWKDIFHYDFSFIHTRVQFQIWNGSLFMVLGFFILGMLAASHNFFAVVQRLKHRFLYLIPAGIALVISMQYLLLLLDQPTYSGSLWYKSAGFLITCVLSLTAVFTNVLIVALMMEQRFLATLMLRLADVGKMALTNYLMQTVFALFLFYHVGMGLYRVTTPAENFMLAIGVFAVQMGYSTLWLKYFNYGIVEWLLRIATLGKYSRLTK